MQGRGGSETKSFYGLSFIHLGVKIIEGVGTGPFIEKPIENSIFLRLTIILTIVTFISLFAWMNLMCLWIILIPPILAPIGIITGLLAYFKFNENKGLGYAFLNGIFVIAWFIFINILANSSF